MAYIVAEPCIKCKFTDCVEQCPVDCFYEGKDTLVIDPIGCIDCGACEPACPVGAIFVDHELPEKWSDYVQYNESMSQIWPNISDPKDPHPEAEAYRSVESKNHLRNEESAD